MLTKHPSKEMNAYPMSSEVNQSIPFTKVVLTPQGAKAVIRRATDYPAPTVTLWT
ncbi:MAG: hypothetical protein RBS07_09205 [Lentimicrobium sp.]|nr:hypothetical protein [Lentimicrobium sp.]